MLLPDSDGSPQQDMPGIVSTFAPLDPVWPLPGAACPADDAEEQSGNSQSDQSSPGSGMLGVPLDVHHGIDEHTSCFG